jgi:hypothetical protein
MLQMKFSIFIKSITLVYWKAGGAQLDFYTKGEQNGYIEHAIVEISFDQKAQEILKKYNEQISLKLDNGQLQ